MHGKCDICISILYLCSILFDMAHIAFAIIICRTEIEIPRPSARRSVSRRLRQCPLIKCLNQRHVRYRDVERRRFVHRDSHGMWLVYIDKRYSKLFRMEEASHKKIICIAHPNAGVGCITGIVPRLGYRQALHPTYRTTSISIRMQDRICRDDPTIWHFRSS